MKINEYINIDDSEIKFKFKRSSGPGGQNVNKVSSAVELYFNLNDSKSLTPEIKLQLNRGFRHYINRKGMIVITSDKFRNQTLNRKDVIDRFKSIIRKSVIKRKKRITTKPSVTSVIKRLNDKRYLSKLKKSRKIITEERV